MNTVFYAGTSDKDWTDESKAMLKALHIINEIMLTKDYEDSAQDEVHTVSDRLQKADLSRSELIDYLTQACIDFEMARRGYV